MKAISPSIKTTSKINKKTGEIINPTKKDIINYNSKYDTIRFHNSAETNSAGKYHPKAPTPFELVGGGLKSIGKAVKKVAQKAATPLVKEFKIQEKKDNEYRRKMANPDIYN